MTPIAVVPTLVLAERALSRASERAQESRAIARECGADVHSRVPVLAGQAPMTTSISAMSL